MSVTELLLGVMILASVAGLSFAPVLLERSLFRPYWLVPKRQYTTLITSGFMHANLAHLAFNAFTFWSFGRALEGAIGSQRLLVLYLLGLLVSNGGTWLKHRADPAYASLGASGAILAVLFASVVYFPTQSLYILPLPVPIPAPWFAVGIWPIAGMPAGSCAAASITTRISAARSLDWPLWRSPIRTRGGGQFRWLSTSIERCTISRPVPLTAIWSPWQPRSRSA